MVDLELFTYHQALRNAIETAEQFKAALEILKAASVREFSDDRSQSLRAALEQLKVVDGSSS